MVPGQGYQLACHAMQPLQVDIPGTQLPRPQHVVLLLALHAPPGCKPGDNSTRYYTILSTPLQVWKAGDYYTQMNEVMPPPLTSDQHLTRHTHRRGIRVLFTMQGIALAPPDC